MVLAGDPLEPRFKMTVGTAQVGGTYRGASPDGGEEPIGVKRGQPRNVLWILILLRRQDPFGPRSAGQNLAFRPSMKPCGSTPRIIGLSRV